MLRPLFIASSLVACGTFFAACGDDDGPETPAASGGSVSSGGAVGSGGTQSSGGTAASGGSSAGGAGGGPASGGTPGSGGASEEDGGVPVDVTIDDGPVRGALKNGVNAFLGIPFAATTGGANRWKSPQPVTKWTEPKQATEYGPICPQNAAGRTTYDPASSEDCLNLNVWSRDITPGAKKPVLVWIYGGAFVFGSGGGAYEGTKLAANKDVVVVTFNYRLSALGFLVHPALEAESPTAPHGAYGIEDQIAALKWVKANIAKFGGDPDNVTLFGESAGARSTCFHLLSDMSKGLFHKAIVESGFCTTPGDPIATARARGERFATAKGCTDAANVASCLRALPPEQLSGGPASPQPGGLFYQNDADVFFFQAIVDGTLLKDQPDKLLAAGTIANEVPTVHGATTAEGALFSAGIFQDTPVKDETEYLAALTRRFRDKAPDIVARYPVASFAKAQDALDEVSSDAFFVCGARRMARHLTAAGVKNYLYSFDGKIDPPLIAGLKDKSFHSADIPYVFGNDYVLGPVPASGFPLRDAVQNYWTTFAKTGVPTPSGGVAWPEYTTAGDQHLALAAEIKAGTGLKKDLCDFWDATPVPFP